MKRQKDITPKDESPKSIGVQYAPGKNEGELLISPERMRRLGQSGNDAQLWMCLVVNVKSDAARTTTAKEPGMVGP